MVSLNSRMMMFLKGHHFVSFFKIHYVTFHPSLAGLVSSFCILVVSSGPSKFDFYTDVLLLYQAVFVLSAIVCTVRDNCFKFSFATFVFQC